MLDLQLIFVVETSKQSKSDWIYIKETIDKFFIYDNAHVKLSVVYMNGKSRYSTKEKEITSLKSQFDQRHRKCESKVMYCFDCDEYDKKREDADFLEKVERFCKEKKYDLVWFCKDIEQVYLGKRIANNKKTDEAKGFKSRNDIEHIDKKNLSCDIYKVNKSNIINVIGKYLELK